MKKTVSILLAIVMHISLIAVIGFDKQITNIGKGDVLKFGLGITSSYGSVKNFTAEANGEAELIVNVAAVLVDIDGKIVSCQLDCADSIVQFDLNGKTEETGDLLTKYEKGESYNMVAWGGAVAEWYEQADAFEKLCIGKTLDEVKALAADQGKGTVEVISAGCTIAISDFINSVEAAVNSATESKVKVEDKLNLGIVTSAPLKETADDTKSFDINTTVVAACTDTDGKVSAAITDVVSVTITTDKDGKVLTDTGAEVKSKKALGDNYYMAQYGADLNGDGVVKEWYEQAKVFDNALIDKNATEIGTLADEIGYGSADIQTAGCTIHVGDMVKAAIKAAAV